MTVVLVETDHRYTNMEWKPNQENLDPPKYVDFVEFSETKLGKPWGYWKVEDGIDIPITAEATSATHVCSDIADVQVNPHGKEQSVVVHSSRCAQNITFLQLEDCDFL
jgi:hypothetical protein